MTDEQLLDRIAMDPSVMVGKPVIKGTRLTVEYILNLLAHGATAAEILEEYDGLVGEDLQACLLFATKSLEGVSFMRLTVGTP
ncbi:MAG TPA: DUF433 domain-containing protein [Blastocatellia bacterium]|nr:DUF433 domain-containing protein [Blastocatellia bacterium]